MYVFAIIFLGILAPVAVIVILPDLLARRRVRKLIQRRDYLQKALAKNEQEHLEHFEAVLEDPKLGELGESRKPPQLEGDSPGGPFRGAK